MQLLVSTVISFLILILMLILISTTVTTIIIIIIIMIIIIILLWTQTWPIANIQQLDREGRKIIVENGGNHPKGSIAILYMSRKLGGRGLDQVRGE